MDPYPTHCPLCSAPPIAEGSLMFDCDCDDRAQMLAVNRWIDIERKLLAFRASLPREYRHYFDRPVPDELAGSLVGTRLSGMGEKSMAYLYGPPAQGKTHLAVQAAARLIREHAISGLFVGEEDYFAQVFGEFRGGDPAPDLKKPGVLVFDDFGKQKGTDFSFLKIYGMFEGRYAGGKALLVTSQFHPTDVMVNVCPQEMQAASVLSRIYAGSVIEMDGGDDRRGGTRE